MRTIALARRGRARTLPRGGGRVWAGEVEGDPAAGDRAVLTRQVTGTTVERQAARRRERRWPALAELAEIDQGRCSRWPSPDPEAEPELCQVTVAPASR